jgi:hypothetical protein
MPQGCWIPVWMAAALVFAALVSATTLLVLHYGQQAQVDAHSQEIRLEYKFESLSHAATLTASLNAGYDTPPWRLEAGTGMDSAHAPSQGGGGHAGQLDFQAGTAQMTSKARYVDDVPGP